MAEIGGESFIRRQHIFQFVYRREFGQELIVSNIQGQQLAAVFAIDMRKRPSDKV